MAPPRHGGVGGPTCRCRGTLTCSRGLKFDVSKDGGVPYLRSDVTRGGTPGVRRDRRTVRAQKRRRRDRSVPDPVTVQDGRDSVITHRGVEDPRSTTTRDNQNPGPNVDTGHRVLDSKTSWGIEGPGTVTIQVGGSQSWSRFWTGGSRLDGLRRSLVVWGRNTC